MLLVARDLKKGRIGRCWRPDGATFNRGSGGIKCVR